MEGVSLRLLVLKTRQVDKLRAFYQAIGIDLHQEQHGSGPIHFAGQLGDVVLEVYPLPNNTAHVDDTTRLGFAVANITGVVEALQITGTPAVTQPNAAERGRRAVVRDPDGRAVELYER